MDKREKSFYMGSIEHEVARFSIPEFVGNVSFHFNMKNGNVANMNVEMKKSIRMPEDWPWPDEAESSAKNI